MYERLLQWWWEVRDAGRELLARETIERDDHYLLLCLLAIACGAAAGAILVYHYGIGS